MQDYSVQKTDTSSSPTGLLPEHPLFGTITTDSPLIQEIIQSNAFQRLAYIHQYGPSQYRLYPCPYTRQLHSLGVYALLRMAQASTHEQAAGLLHDISHTVFSHVGDILFSHTSTTASYQDDIFKTFLVHTDIPAILEKRGLVIDDINPKSGLFNALEQDLPNVCADRLEYTLTGAYFCNVLTLDNCHKIIASLQFTHNTWIFTDVAAARQYATAALMQNKNIWGGAANGVGHHLCALLLKKGLEKNILTLHDIHWSTDSIVLATLQQSTDPEIQKLLHALLAPLSAVIPVDAAEQADISFKPKFRGVDPLVRLTPEAPTPHRLSMLDPHFAELFEETRNSLTTTHWKII